MPSKTTKRFVLPLIVFPTLIALTVKCMLGPIEPSGLAAKLKSQCSSPDITPFAQAYTGNARVDARLCGLIAFFHQTMAEPLGLQFLIYFMVTGAALTTFPILEGSRSRKNLLFAFPLLWVLFGQIATIAISTNVYSLLFILTGSHLGKKREDKKITRAYAESLIFGLVAGLVGPSVGMIVLQDPQVTAIWQVYPIIMSVASGVHLLVHRPSKFSGSGWSFVQALLLGIFVVSSSFHFATVWPLINDHAALKALFAPSLVPLPQSTPFGLQTLDFLKWDAVFAFTSLTVTTLWFAKGVTQFVALIIWYIVMIPAVGPGAAITGVLLWRESKLQ